jgi:hypothetical protein
MRFRACNSKVAKCVDRSGSPGHILWVYQPQGEERAAQAQTNHGGSRPIHASTTFSINITGRGAGSNLRHVVPFDVQVLARERLREVRRAAMVYHEGTFTLSVRIFFWQR